MTITLTNPPELPPPVGQYSNVAVAPAGSDVVFVAGQLPFDEEGRLIAPGDFGAQCAYVYGNLSRALTAAGSSMADVAFIRAFLVDEARFAGFRAARAEAFATFGVDQPPPATTVVVSALVGGSLIELDAVAFRREGSYDRSPAGVDRLK